MSADYIGWCALVLVVLALWIMSRLWGRLSKLEKLLRDKEDFDLFQVQGQIDCTRKMMCEGFEVLGLERVPPTVGKWERKP